jgi:hypothetical protein
MGVNDFDFEVRIRKTGWIIASAAMPLDVRKGGAFP